MAAPSISTAPNAYPAKTEAREPLSISTPKSERGDHAAEPRADGVEDRDRERANLEREGFAHREIGRARRRRGKEEDHHPGKRLARGR